jgi:hypothetical protein
MKFVQNKNTVYKIVPLLYYVFCVRYFYLFLILSNYKLDLSNIVCVNANNFFYVWFGFSSLQFGEQLPIWGKTCKCNPKIRTITYNGISQEIGV